MIARFLHNCDAATAIEYAMIASFVAIGIITAVTSVGVDLKTMLAAVNAGFTAAP